MLPVWSMLPVWPVLAVWPESDVGSAPVWWAAIALALTLTTLRTKPKALATTPKSFWLAAA